MGRSESTQALDKPDQKSDPLGGLHECRRIRARKEFGQGRAEYLENRRTARESNASAVGLSVPSRQSEVSYGDMNYTWMSRKKRCRGERMQYNLKALKKCFKAYKGHNALACLAYGIDNMEKELKKRIDMNLECCHSIDVMMEVLGE